MHFSTFDPLKNNVVTIRIRRSKVNYNGFSTFDLLRNVKNCPSHDKKIGK
jgi:hypothetical protein